MAIHDWRTHFLAADFVATPGSATTRYGLSSALSAATKMLNRVKLKEILLRAPRPVLGVARTVVVRPLRAYIRFAPWSFGKLWLYDRLASHLWWLETTVDCRSSSGFSMNVDAADIVGKHIYYFGVWEPRLTRWIAQRLEAGDVFVDVGANVGYYTLLASKLVGNSGRIVSIEAMPEIFERLKANIAMNDASNVRLVNSAAWNKNETLTIFANDGHASGVTTVMPEWATRWELAAGAKVEARPLGDILAQRELAEARLIKIDVEGAEWPVISEMAGWLSRTSPRLEVVVEVSRRMLESHQKDLRDVMQIFREHGFRCYRVENDYLASSCLNTQVVYGPKLEPVNDWPDPRVDQVDLIFSRANLGDDTIRTGSAVNSTSPMAVAD